MTSGIYLASASPRRRELLGQLLPSFEILAAAVDETPAPGATPREYVVDTARKKARAVAQQVPSDSIVIAGDTTVAIETEVLGKPADEADAVRMLMSLSGRWHTVYSAVVIVAGSSEHTASTATDVHFATLTEPQAHDYWRSGEPRDKAGAYAIQGLGSRFIREIRGSYTGVVGLPLWETAELLTALDVGVAA